MIREQQKTAALSAHQAVRTKSRHTCAAVRIDLLAAADTQAMPVLSLGEALNHPHNRARGMVVDVHLDGDERPLRQLGLPFHLSDTPPVPPRPAGLPGAETSEILAELGLGNDEMASLERDGAFRDRRGDRQ